MTRARSLPGAGPGGLALALSLAAALAPAATAAGTPAARPPPPPLDAPVTVDRFAGTARGRDGAVLYREEHEVRRAGARPLSALTTYRDPAGQVRAVLRTDFGRDPYAPDYRFEDRARAAVEEVAIAPDGATLSAGDRRRTLPLPSEPGARLVTGQGLDRLVRARLSDLEAGAQLRVTFAIPSRLDAYAFRVRALPGGAGETTRVRVEIDSWVLRLFASALDTEYDRATGRLVRYRGPSNLVDERGENPEVEITYVYPDGGAPAEEASHEAL